MNSTVSYFSALYQFFFFASLSFRRLVLSSVLGRWMLPPVSSLSLSFSYAFFADFNTSSLTPSRAHYAKLRFLNGFMFFELSLALGKT